MDQPSLDGLTVGVTADGRAHEELDLLSGFGAHVLHGPTVCSAPASHDDGLRSATLNVVEQAPDFVVAETGLGMRAWISAADVWGIGAGLRGALAQSRIVVGSDGAATAMGDNGLAVTARLSPTTGRLLVAELAEFGVAGRRVALERNDPDRAPRRAELLEAGAIVLDVPVHEWSLPAEIGPARRLVEAVVAGRVNAVTFTSAPAIRNLVLIAEELGRAAELIDAFNHGVVAMCVGPVCATTARRCGITAPVLPPKFRLGPMVRELAMVLSSMTRRFRFGDHELVLRGSVIELDSDRIELDDREAAVLRALLVRPGVAISRRELLAEVWGDRSRDDHVVEVAVRRLRRRLGTCADVVVAVPRRGFQFNGHFAA